MVKRSLFATLMIAAVGHLPAHAQDATFDGTYEIRICHGECEPTATDRDLAHGFLVLETTSFHPDELPATVRAYFERFAFELLFARAGGAPNSCFVLARTGREGTYAGTTRVGLTKWAVERDTIFLPLFQSPDAGYNARIRVADGVIRGRGQSYGFGPARVDYPDDVIVGQRIGPADRSICIRAAKEEDLRRQKERERRMEAERRRTG